MKTVRVLNEVVRSAKLAAIEQELRDVAAAITEISADIRTEAKRVLLATAVKAIRDTRAEDLRLYTNYSNEIALVEIKVPSSDAYVRLLAMRHALQVKQTQLNAKCSAIRDCSTDAFILASAMGDKKLVELAMKHAVDNTMLVKREPKKRTPHNAVGSRNHGAVMD